MAKRRLLAGLIFSLSLIASVVAAPPTTAIIGTPPQPGWTQLSPGQKEILAPLARDWDAMESLRKKQWLGIAERYPNMKPNEQLRVQARMQEWVRMTPEQRAKVRDTYKDFSQLPAEQKKAVKEKWNAYRSLSPEEQQRLREGGKSTQLLTPVAEPVSSAEPTAAPATEPPASEAGIAQ